MPRITTRRLLIGDVDSAGIAFTGRIIDIAMEVLEQGLHQVGIDFATMIKEGACGVPLVHLEADFKRPMRHGDAIHGELVCEQIGTSSYTTRIDLILDATGTLAASVRSVAVCVDPRTEQSIPLPAVIRKGLERLMAPV